MESRQRPVEALTAFIATRKRRSPRTPPTRSGFADAAKTMQVETATA
jgi:hypothetical protein